MSRDASITFEWGDGEHTFVLKWGQLVKLQEATDCGPKYLYDMLMAGRWRVEHISETIRWGLIGGGKKPEEANKLLKLYVEGFPLLDNVGPAIRILGAALAGAPDEPPGEASAPNPAGESPSTISLEAS